MQLFHRLLMRFLKLLKRMSIKIKMKPCKGMGKAKAYVGCGHDFYERKHGLCKKCYATWLLTTAEGKAEMDKHITRTTKHKPKPKLVVKKTTGKKAKPHSKLQAYPELYEKENRAGLQAHINKIVRLIDKNCKCIDCTRTRSKQWDAGHYHSRGNMPALAFNMHNIFQQSGHCNFHSEGNKAAYLDGIAQMYGEKYAAFVDSLPKRYPKSGITAKDIPDLKKIAAKIMRDLKKADRVYTPAERVQLREEINQRIGVYTQGYAVDTENLLINNSGPLFSGL